MTQRSFNDWLEYLEELNPYKIQLGFERIAIVAQRSQVTSFPCPVITVTGTNGKGSCVAILEAILLAAGYRVGAYTSPHLFHFNERIRINGIEIDSDSLSAAFAEIENARSEASLTYFEFTTLAALKIFQQAKLDVLILEVGVGGRLDAVNIVDADMAIISTIDIDHTNWLGPDRESIGREKAGIFRAGKLAICGDFSPPQSVYDVASTLQTKLYVSQKDFFYQQSALDWHWQTKDCDLPNLPKPTLELQNAATALMAIHLSQSRLPATLSAIKQGLKNAHLPGRFQRQGDCIFDVAHNPHAAKWLAKKLVGEPVTGLTLGVVGMLADKDITGTLSALNDQVDVWYVGGLAVPRGAPNQLLVDILEGIGVKKCYNYIFIKQAFLAAMAAKKAMDRVVIFGSFHTVSACMDVLRIYD